ncbi:MAG: hypothetical protein FWH22_02325 [Fibromonadales bacterium]|nr:hypothetical protein [Fibromonadales bacterium]
MKPLLLAALALLPECPYFYEFFPDPVEVPDNEGEYLIVKWENSVVPWDTIYLQMDNNRASAVYVPPDSFFTELLLHRGAPEACPAKSGLLCLPLAGTALPNSRASVWNLRAGICRDTAYLPVPKAGMFIRRIENGEWKIENSSDFNSDSVLTLDSLLSFYGEIPLYISEAAPCPEEGIPEWFEVSNRTVFAFPLNGISDCKAKTPIRTADSIKGRSSILITKDSTDLRAFLQTGEIPIYQIPIATLKNLADTLRLCYNGIKLDSVMWGKAVNRQIKCPSTESISPGFVPRISNQAKVLQISERVLARSKKNSMLRVRINSEKTIELRLIDRGGVGIVKKTIGVQEMNSSWIAIPEWRRCQNGPCFIHVQGEEVDETAAFIVRP